MNAVSQLSCMKKPLYLPHGPRVIDVILPCWDIIGGGEAGNGGLNMEAMEGCATPGRSWDDHVESLTLDTGRKQSE